MSNNKNKKTESNNRFKSFVQTHKIGVIIFSTILCACIVLAFLKPSKQEMTDPKLYSQSIQDQIKKDAEIEKNNQRIRAEQKKKKAEEAKNKSQQKDEKAKKPEKKNTKEKKSNKKAKKEKKSDKKAKKGKKSEKKDKKEDKIQIKSMESVYNDLIVINYAAYKNVDTGEEQAYVGFCGMKIHADEGVGETTGQMVRYTYTILGIGEGWIAGVKLTILLTVLSLFFGILFGIFLALGKISKNIVISKISSGYIFFFRGTPLLIQLFIIYWTIPELLGFDTWKNIVGDADAGRFVAALIAFSLNSAAYCAEIIRAAIQSIDKGQSEAAKSLGMSYGQTMSKIIIPQSVRRMIPPLCNEFIMILKDVSLVFAIALMDITTKSNTITNNEGNYLAYIPALIIYLIITAFFTFIFNRIEKKFSVYE